MWIKGSCWPCEWPCLSLQAIQMAAQFYRTNAMIKQLSMLRPHGQAACWAACQLLWCKPSANTCWWSFAYRPFAWLPCTDRVSPQGSGKTRRNQSNDVCSFDDRHCPPNKSTKKQEIESTLAEFPFRTISACQACAAWFCSADHCPCQAMPNSMWATLDCPKETTVSAAQSCCQRRKEARLTGANTKNCAATPAKLRIPHIKAGIIMEKWIRA